MIRKLQFNGFSKLLTLLGLTFINILFTIPVAIPLTLSLYAIFDCLYIVCALLILSPVLLIADYFIHMLPIGFAPAYVPFALKVIVAILAHWIGRKMLSALRPFSSEFHSRVMGLKDRFIGWNSKFLNQ